MTNMQRLGLFNIDGVNVGERCENPIAAYARLKEISAGKDTTTGHWEMAGLVSEKSFPIYPNGFPYEIISEFERRTKKGVLCNKPYSGTKVIHDYGREHIETGKLIVYTSADSVFQIAAHESIVPREELYKYCIIAREILTGVHSVARVIARPFAGEYPSFERTAGRHDFSVLPPEKTMLDILKDNSLDVIGIGKIYDIFAGKGLSESILTKDNADGMNAIFKCAERDFSGLCFLNLVDFDMKYGHRNDIDGYAEALRKFDEFLPSLIDKLRDDDVLMITADHGCDPGFRGTDHTREDVPLLIYKKDIRPKNLGAVRGFNCIAKTVLAMLDVKNALSGEILNV